MTLCGYRGCQLVDMKANFASEEGQAQEPGYWGERLAM